MELMNNLSNAGPGDVIRVGDCEVQGTFVLPAGVTLVGTTPDSALRSTSDRHTLDVVPGTDNEPTRLAGLSVRSAAIGGVVIMGDGRAIVESVVIESARGVGLFGYDLSALELTDVTLVGAIDPSNVGSFVMPAPSVETAPSHGVALTNVQNATLRNVSVRGYAFFGALFENSTVDWQGGNASLNVNVGIYATQGDLTLQDVTVSDSIENPRGDAPVAMAVVTSNTTLNTSAVRCEDNRGFGLVQFGGQAQHSGLALNRNRNGGAWLQSVQGTTISGEVLENTYVGVSAIDSTNLRLEDTTVARTIEDLGMRTQDPQISIGYGVHLVDSLSGTLLQRLNLEANEDAGLVVELNGQNLPSGLFDNVTITRTNDQQLGAIVQGGMRAPDWDTGLNRDQATQMLDDNFTGTLPVVGTFPEPPVAAVGPCFFPRP